MSMFTNQNIIYYSNPPKVELVAKISFPEGKVNISSLPTGFRRSMDSIFSRVNKRDITSVTLVDGKPQDLEHSFLDYFTQDEKFVVSISESVLLITSREYQQWLEFRKNLERITTFFLDVFEVEKFERLGLRWHNLFDPVQLGGEISHQKDWQKMLAKHIVGPLNDDLFTENITALEGRMAFPVENNFRIGDNNIDIKAATRYGFAWYNGRTISSTPFPQGVGGSLGREAFWLEIDVFSGNPIVATCSNVLECFDRFDKISYGIFRWSISDKMHNQLSPIEGR